MKKNHILQFAFDEIRVVSEFALENMFNQIVQKGEKKLVIDLWSIEEYGYWFFLLSTLKVNKDSCLENHSEKENIKIKKIFNIFYKQLLSMSVDEKKCFDNIIGNDSKMLIKCSDYLFSLLIERENFFYIFDELKGKYNNLNIFK